MNQIAVPLDISEEANQTLYRAFAKFLSAFQNCGAESQQIVQDMIEIINDLDSDDAEQQAAMRTISEALFPSGQDSCLPLDFIGAEETDSPTDLAIFKEMDEEENTFAQKLEHFMKKKNLTQRQLADRVGVGQPAISMMLARKCRPQKRTVEKIAEALNVSDEF